MPNLKKNRRQSLKLLLLGLFGLFTKKAVGSPSQKENKGSTYLNPIRWDRNEKLKIAYILFDGITLLDFIGIYDPISRIKSKGFMENLSWDLCATAEFIQDSFGLRVGIDKIKPDLSGYDMIIVPGGFGTRPLQFNEEFMQWLKTAKDVEYKVSVCTGSLLLGSAGFLSGKIATTNFNEYETLNNYCKTVSKNRIVDDHNVITAGAVASSLDLGLYMCEKLIGKENTEVIRKSMDYAPGEFEVINNY